MDPRFQLKYSILFALVGATVAGTCAAVVYILEQPVSRAEIVGALVGVGALSAMFLGFWGVLLTHRIAGPIYVMTQFLGELAEGRFPVTRPIRRSDELKVFFLLFQRSLAAVRSKEIEETFKIEEAIFKLSSSDSPQAKDVLVALRALRDAKLAATGNLDPRPQEERADHQHPLPLLSLPAVSGTLPAKK